MAYSAEEVDKLVTKLEQKTERQIATMTSAVKGVAAERDLLSAAEDIRDLLDKAVKGEKEHLDEVFGGTCERIGRCRICLDRVEFSDMHKKDQRWPHLKNAVDMVEAILRELGTYKPWAPPTVKAPSNITCRGLRRRISPGRRVNWRMEIEGEQAEFTVEPALPAGLELSSTTGMISGIPVGATLEEVTYVVTAKNEGGQVSTEITFSVREVPPGNVTYPSATSQLVTGEVVSWRPEVDGGAATEWSVTPKLPVGLKLDAATGIISGSCAEAFDEAEYVVEASNPGGKASATLRVAVRIAAPTSLVYAGLAQATMLDLGGYAEFVPEAMPGLQFSVAPSLPEGLAFDEASGKISGTPSVEAAMATYEVIARNKGGEVTATLEFGVHLVPPSQVRYADASARLQTDAAIEWKPEVVGAVSDWSVSPTLPQGLTIDSERGIISGKPLEVAETASWTVTASNSAGKATCELHFAVQLAPPSKLTFAAAEQEYALLAPMSIMSTFDGRVETFSISPELPDGVHLDTQSGEISGTPRSTTGETTYEVVASNGSGSTSTSITFSVVLMPPSSLRYPSLRASYQALEDIPASDGLPEVVGSVSSFAVAPPLPEGLSVDEQTGAISGVAAAPADSGSYVITASNEVGSTSASFALTIVVPPPGELSYPSASSSYAVGENVKVEPALEGCTLGTCFSVQPALPEGLTLDPESGVISGTPDAACEETTYRIVVKNDSGTSTAEVVIQVVDTINAEEVSKTIDTAFAEQIEAVTDIAEMLPEPSKTKLFGDWMIWMVHRAHLDDPTLVEFDFSNLHMPPPHIEARIAPKLMKAMESNTHIEILSLPNSNLMKVQGHELAESIKANTTLRHLNLESNNLDSAAVKDIAEAVAKNTDSKLEILRVTSQKQVAEFFGRPVEEAFGSMMEKNETIIKLGFPCDDAHWRNIIDRALLRNNDYHRRRKYGKGSTEDDVQAEEKTLSKLVLMQPPKRSAAEVFAEAPAQHKVFLNYLIKEKRVPTGSQLQSFARNEGETVKYSTVAPLLKACRSKLLDSAVESMVTVFDDFGADYEGKLRSWSEANQNWALDIWAAGKRYAYKSNKDPALAIADSYAEWLAEH